MNLLSDAAQSQTWPTVAPLITKGKTLYFSHGFSVVYKEDTKVIPPKDVDVILVAPKGSGRTVRTLFKEGRGINSSVAVFQDVSGKAMEKAVALGVAVGSGYMYETTFQKEVYSDLYGERGVLMGAIRKFSHTVGYLQLMVSQRVCSARSTKCSVLTATLPRKPSTKLLRRPLNHYTP